MSDKKLLTEIMSTFVGERMPVTVTEPSVRTSPERWELTDEKILRKRYEFLSMDERNGFLYTLFQQDAQCGSRPARTTVDGLFVTVELGTNGGLLIDLDKHRAKMMDALWRDVVYSIGGRKF